MARVEFTGRTHVVPGRAFHRPGIYEVSDDLAKNLISEEPKLFKAVGGNDDSDQNPEKPVSTPHEALSSAGGLHYLPPATHPSPACDE